MKSIENVIPELHSCKKIRIFNGISESNYNFETKRKCLSKKNKWYASKSGSYYSVSSSISQKTILDLYIRRGEIIGCYEELTSKTSINGHLRMNFHNDIIPVIHVYAKYFSGRKINELIECVDKSVGEYILKAIEPNVSNKIYRRAYHLNTSKNKLEF